MNDDSQDNLVNVSKETSPLRKYGVGEKHYGSEATADVKVQSLKKPACQHFKWLDKICTPNLCSFFKFYNLPNIMRLCKINTKYVCQNPMSY